VSEFVSSMNLDFVALPRGNLRPDIFDKEPSFDLRFYLRFYSRASGNWSIRRNALCSLLIPLLDSSERTSKLPGNQRCRIASAV